MTLVTVRPVIWPCSPGWLFDGLRPDTLVRRLCPPGSTTALGAPSFRALCERVGTTHSGGMLISRALCEKWGFLNYVGRTLLSDASASALFLRTPNSFNHLPPPTADFSRLTPNFTLSLSYPCHLATGTIG